MKRKLWLFIIIVSHFVLLTAQFAGGTGSAADPWLIANPGQLNAIRNYLGAEHADKHFKLTSDIDLGLSGWGYWVPIGWNTPFYGSLDGNSHIVSNMTINTLHNDKAGFIGTATNASITNLTLSDLSISIGGEYSIEAGGLVVISNNSTIDNCRVSGYIGLGNDGNPDVYVAFAGGLVGKQNLASVVSNSSSACSTISSAYVRLDLMPGTSISMQNIGGLIGQNFGTIINSYSTGVVNSTIDNHFSIPGFITVATGGLAGSNEGSITNCYSSSQVHGMSGVGGLVGCNSGQIVQCYADGDVWAYLTMGAFAGENSGEISNSYTRGSLKYDPLTSVIDEEGWDTIIYSGGFLGYNTGSIVNCYSTSGIDWLWYDPLDFSGFVSYNDGNVLNCYWDIESSAADSSAAGYGRLTKDMNHPHSDSTYVGWDFDEIWFADTQGLINDSYPLLRWQFQQPLAEFSASITEGFAPLTVDFFDHSLPGSGGDIQWLWDFGDGETSVLQNPTHVYNDAGVYSVSLQVTDAYGTQALTELPDLIHALQASPMISLLSANSASFGSVFVEESSPYLPVVIGSIGGAEVTISDVHFVSESSHFELMNPFRNIIVAHGESDTLWVRFSPHTVGALGDTLYIVNNSLNEPLLKVRLTGNGMHVLPASPQNIDISVEGNNVQLFWDAVTQNLHGNSITPDYYFVYIATNPYGQFSLMTICNSPNAIHPFVVIGAERMFYKVTAVKLYRDDLSQSEKDFLVSGYLNEGMLEIEVDKAIEQIRQVHQ